GLPRGSSNRGLPRSSPQRGARRPRCSTRSRAARRRGTICRRPGRISPACGPRSAAPDPAARRPEPIDLDRSSVTFVFQMTGGRVTLDRRPVLRGVDLTIAEGEAVPILGPNGSGRSTLVRALLGLVPLSGGTTLLYGVPPARFRDWKRIGYVPQRLTAGGGVPATVREVVLSGRIARQRRWRRTSPE